MEECIYKVVVEIYDKGNTNIETFYGSREEIHDAIAQIQCDGMAIIEQTKYISEQSVIELEYKLSKKK